MTNRHNHHNFIVRRVFAIYATFVPNVFNLFPIVSAFVAPSRQFGRSSFHSQPKLLMSASVDSKVDHVVIAGAGIVGTTTAYFLAMRYDVRVTLVDPTGSIAPAASGKAGGFLAKDWNDNSPTEALTRRSFDLHQQLADELGANTIQYRRLTCAAVSVDPFSSRRPNGKKLSTVEWAQHDDLAQNTVRGMQPLGDESTIAQVHPKRLCEELWKAAKKRVGGNSLRQGSVIGAVHDHESGRLQGAKLGDGSLLECDALLFACGPWTAPSMMQGVKYHSVVIPTSRVLSQCVFFSGCGDPEVYVRPDQTAYCTGFPEAAVVVDEQPGEESIREDKLQTILESVRDASGISGTGDGVLSQEPVLGQACYLPTSIDGIPVMGRIPEQLGCYVAAGHGCWGILLGPATGEVMANLIVNGSSIPNVNMEVFNPTRFATPWNIPTAAAAALIKK
jgi:glycine/D-amino acid oxidase-like deaminating enzyme